MRKFLFILIFGGLLVCSCQSGKNSTSKGENVDSVAEDTTPELPDTFFGCKLGDSRDSVLSKMKKSGFTNIVYDSPKKVQLTKEDCFEYLGIDEWGSIFLYFIRGELTGVSFAKWGDQAYCNQLYLKVFKIMSPKYHPVDVDIDLERFALLKGKDQVGKIYCGDDNDDDVFATFLSIWQREYCDADYDN